MEFGSLVAGVVDTGLHDAAFGPRVPIPFAKPFNDTWTMGKARARPRDRCSRRTHARARARARTEPYGLADLSGVWNE